MAISITWTDSADGTGGVVTITGADAASVTVWAQAVDATGLRSPTFTQVGSRTGDGTVTLTLAPGYFWLYARGLVSAALAYSNFLYAYATDHADAMAVRCADALAARVAGLTMTTTVGVSVPNTNIYKVLLPEPEGKFTFPCVIISHESNREGMPGTTNNKDDIEYPINVCLCDKHGADFDTKKGVWLKWRQQVFKAIRNQRLAGITESLTVRMDPMLVIDPKLPAYQHVWSGFVARCLVRETRGD